MSEVTLIFTHFGYSNYLEYTLSCARMTNPKARLVLLGDRDNYDVAVRNGWEHFNYESFTNEFHARFARVFRHVRGKKFNPIKNGRDWLRYVFERWFFLAGFLDNEAIDRFWHFDSDTMVLQDLAPYEQDLAWADFTVQCNNTCLNGLARTVVVSEYCEHICELFEDAEFIAKQQDEFDSINPQYAFSEMRAFDHYKHTTSRPYIHLLKYQDAKAFDDCICQEHGFEMCTLPSGETIKYLFANDGRLYGLRDGREVEFISLNLSWVPDYVFEWVIDALQGSNSNILQAQSPIGPRILGKARKIKRMLIR